MTHKKPKSRPLPTPKEVMEYIRNARGKVTKRDIARAFSIKGPDKVFLKKILRELAAEGLLDQDRGRALRPSDQLPSVIVAEFAGLDEGGEALVTPASWQGDTPAPKIYLASSGRRGAAPGPGDRMLVRLELIQRDPNEYRANIIKRLEARSDSILGVFHGGEDGGRVHPIDKKQREPILIAAADTAGAQDGELVLVDPIGKRRKHAPMGRVQKRMGDVSSPRSISLISIHAHDLPHIFPAEVEAAAAKAAAPGLKGREDLRSIPFVTIDPADARDHDDAIYAAADEAPDNPGGFVIMVAIADVAHYVPSGSVIDREARKRGNSVYFPDCVVPMLPETLSAGLCSLQPGEERAAMIADMRITAEGRKLSHRFRRAIIKSQANFTYSDVQHALDGHGNSETEPFLEPVLKPLHAAWHALMRARTERGPLDLEIPERKVELDEMGMVTAISLRERYDSHRIVEEFMILANVAAAEALEAKRTPAMYRVHDEPPMDKLETLRDFLDSIGLNLARGAVIQPQLFNGILRRVKESPEEGLVNEVILRSQTQAYYSGENHGHFGLALRHYAHFTSPIRRYSDLIVHRGLIRAYGLGKDGMRDEEIAEFEDIADHISRTERRAMVAERECVDRYLAAYLSEHVGDCFHGRISGVSRFGLFVTLEPSGGDGLIPISTLGDDFYRLDDTGHALIADRSRKSFKLGDALFVKLLEANKFTGGLRLEIVDESGDPLFEKGRRYSRRRRR